MAIEIALSELGDWLSSQPENTPETAYELNITGLTADNVNTIKDSLKSNSTKYVDLRGTTIPNDVIDMTDTFSNCTSLVYAPVIPDSVTDMYATFDRCTSLVKAPVISNSITSMYLTFRYCTSLKTAPVIPNSVTNMDDTFAHCTSLKTAPVIPDSVTYMNYTFDTCTSLTTVRIPKNVETLGSGTFSGCISLVAVYLECPPSSEINLSNIPDTATIYVEEDNLGAWQEKFPNAEFQAPVTIKLVTLSQLKEYDKARAANMVGRHTYTALDESLIYRATQYTFDESVSAFPGTFYEVTDFIESEQIPQGAKLMYLNDNTIKFCSTLPPHTGLKYGKEETVLANKDWFDNIAWMTETVSVTDFEYSIPTIKVKNADGETRSVATQEVQAFVDSKEDVTEGLLDAGLAKTVDKLDSVDSKLEQVDQRLTEATDKLDSVDSKLEQVDGRLTETADKLNKLDESYLPVGIVVEFLEGDDPNEIYPTMIWAEL